MAVNLDLRKANRIFPHPIQLQNPAIAQGLPDLPYLLKSTCRGDDRVRRACHSTHLARLS